MGTRESRPSPDLRAPPHELGGPYRFAWTALTDANIPTGSRVLEIGCGPGYLLAPLSAAGMQCVGIEVRADVASEARVAAPSSGVVLGDGLHMPLADASFDVAIMLEVLEHVSDEAQLFAEVRRVLRPGGLLVLTTPHAGRWSFLDPDNYKFRAPWLHRLGYRLLGREDEYRRRFDGALFGSFRTDSARRMWHRHYTASDVCWHARGFDARTQTTSGGLVFTLALAASYFSVKLTGRWVWPIPQLLAWDSREVAHGYQLGMTLLRTAGQP